MAASCYQLILTSTITSENPASMNMYMTMCTCTHAHCKIIFTQSISDISSVTFHFTWHLSALGWASLTVGIMAPAYLLHY